jgi:hypothetical protein
MEDGEALVDEAEGNRGAVKHDLKSTSGDNGEDLLDDVCEDFRDRLLSPTGEHHVEVGTTTVSGPKPIPSNAAKIFVRHALKSGLKAAHI